jgi:hypothetical protein
MAGKKKMEEEEEQEGGGRMAAADLRDQKLGYGIKNEEFGRGRVEKEREET